MNATSAVDAFVEETGFGNWFLRTMTWKVHVLNRALNDLQTLLPPGARTTGCWTWAVVSAIRLPSCPSAFPRS